MIRRSHHMICPALLAVVMLLTSAAANCSASVTIGPITTPTRAIELFDQAIEATKTRPELGRELATQSAREFAALAGSSPRARSVQARMYHNAGTAMLLAGDHARAIAFLRAAESRTPVWMFALRADTLHNLAIARSAISTTPATAARTTLSSDADPDRTFAEHAAVLVPMQVWLITGGLLAAIGSLSGARRLLHKSLAFSPLSLSLIAVGACACASGILVDRQLGQRSHAVVIGESVPARAEPDELLAPPVNTQCPSGTEVIILEHVGAVAESDPEWCRVRRLGDSPQTTFWVPRSSLIEIDLRR